MVNTQTEEKNKELSNAESAVANLDSALQDKDAEIKAAKEAKEASRTKAEKAKQDMKDGAFAFFEAINAKGALSVLNSDPTLASGNSEELRNNIKNLSKMTVRGNEGDASNYENILRALDVIEAMNKLREGEGLKPCHVTHYNMAVGAWHANASRWAQHHTAGYHGGENLGFSTGGSIFGVESAIKKWYEGEKKNKGLHYAMITNPEAILFGAGVHTDAKYSNFQDELENQLMDDWEFHFSAVTELNSNNVHFIEWSKQFSDDTESFRFYTVEEYRNLITNWYETLKGQVDAYERADDTIKALEEDKEKIVTSLEEAKAKKEVLAQEVKNLQAALDTKHQELVSLQETVKEKEALRDTIADDSKLQEQLTKAQKAYDDKLSQVDKAKAGLNAAKEALADASIQVDNAKAALEEKDAKVRAMEENFDASIKEARQNLDAAKSASKEAKESYKEFLKVKEDHQKDAKAKEEAYAALKEAVVRTKEKVDAAQVALDRAKELAKDARTKQSHVKAVYDEVLLSRQKKEDAKMALVRANDVLEKDKARFATLPDRIKTLEEDLAYITSLTPSVALNGQVTRDRYTYLNDFKTKKEEKERKEAESLKETKTKGGSITVENTRLTIEPSKTKEEISNDVLVKSAQTAKKAAPKTADTTSALPYAVTMGLAAFAVLFERKRRKDSSRFDYWNR